MNEEFDVDNNRCVIINYDLQDNIWWDETCEIVIKAFGMPGQRFKYSCDSDSMIFRFETIQDTLMCKLLLSYRL